MSVFLVNIGNTHTQVCCEDLSELQTLKSADFVKYAQQSFRKEDNLYIASVVKELREPLEQLELDVEFLHHSHLNINFSKVSPETIGADRLANIAAVANLKQNILVLDCGTCVTAEFISQSGSFDGGFIMPGRSLSRKALNSFTSQLPEVPLSNNYILLGTSTEEAIQSGIDSMSGLAVQKYTEELSKIYEEMSVVLTGGDAPFYSKFISSKFNTEELLTLKGLQAVFCNKS